MSIQQNINQLIGLTGTAMMLNPQLRQRAEDNTKLRKLDKEEAGLNALQEASKQQMSSKEYRDATIRINELKNLENPTKLEQTELKTLQNARIDFFAARDERFNRLTEISDERAKLRPTEENIAEAQRMRESNSFRKTFKEKRNRKYGLDEAVKEGQERVQNKQQTEDFQVKVGVREQIGFKPLSEHRDFRRRLNDDTK